MIKTMWVVSEQEKYGCSTVKHICGSFDEAITKWDEVRLQLIKEAKELQFDEFVVELEKLKMGETTSWYFPTIQEFETEV